MSAIAKIKSTAPIRNLAAKCFEESGDNTANARVLMASRIRSDKALTQIFLDHCLERACIDWVHAVVHALRARSVAVVANPDRAQTDGGLVSLAAGNRLDFRLWNGKRLGDATRQEIIDSADRYKAQARTMGITARWLELVAKEMNQHPEDTMAQDVLAPEKLDQLQAEAEHE